MWWYKGTDVFTSLTRKTIKTTFSIRKFNLITIVTLMNSFDFLFYKNPLTLLVSKPPSWKDGSFT